MIDNIFIVIQSFLVLILVPNKNTTCNNIKKLLILFVYFISNTAIELLFKNRYVVDMICSIILAALFYIFYAEAEKKHAILLGMLFTLAMEVSKMITYGTLAFTPVMRMIQQNLWIDMSSRVVIMAIRISLLSIIRLFYKNLEMEKINTGILGYLTLPIITLVCMRILLLPTYRDSYHKFVYDQATIMFFLCLSVIGTTGSGLFALTSVFRRRELERMEQIINLQYRMAEEKQKADDEIRRMNHDMRNQLAGLQQLVNTPEAKQHLQSLSKKLDSYTLQDYTEDRILNALLNEKVHQGEAKNIHIQIFMETAPRKEITTQDLCSIFGNLLDNAMEAVQKVDRDQRFITLKAAQIGKYWVMKITNPYTGTLKQRDGKFISTKIDSEKHGIGLSSVRFSVSHYGGEMISDVKDGNFIVTVMIPNSDY